MNPAICHLIYPATHHIKAAGIEPAISRFRRERDTASLHLVHDKGPLGVEPSSCRLTGGRNPGHAKDPLLPITTKSGWRESNPRVSGWKPDAFPLGDTLIVGPEGVEPSSSRVRGACSASRATDPKSGRSENRTHHARANERRGYGPLDHHWSHSVHVRNCTAGRSRTFSDGCWKPVPFPMGLLP